MKAIVQISRFSQIILLLTFFLPFFPKGCGDSNSCSAREKFFADSIKADSIRHEFVDSILRVHPNANIDSFLNVRNKDLPKVDSVNFKENSDSITSQTDTINQKNNSDKTELSKKLSLKSKFLGILLRPNDNFTGIGFMIDAFLAYLLFFGVWTSFLFFILGLVLKFKDFNSIFILINIVAWILLLFTNPRTNLNLNEIDMNIWEDKLWGYWVSLGFGLILIIYDSIILVQIKKNKTSA